MTNNSIFSVIMRELIIPLKGKPKISRFLFSLLCTSVQYIYCKYIQTFKPDLHKTIRSLQYCICRLGCDLNPWYGLSAKSRRMRVISSMVFHFNLGDFTCLMNYICIVITLTPKRLFTNFLILYKSVQRKEVMCVEINKNLHFSNIDFICI